MLDERRENREKAAKKPKMDQERLFLKQVQARFGF
jgi:hypothetical protein